MGPTWRTWRVNLCAAAAAAAAFLCGAAPAVAASDAAPADLAVTAAVRPQQGTRATETYDYLVTVTNHGPSTARQVTVTDRLPAALEFLASRDGCAATAAGRTVVCGPLPTLAVGASHTWVITVRLAPGYRGEGGDIVNEASVDAATKDPRPANNATSLTGLVLPPSALLADLSLTKTAVLAGGREDVRPGEKFTYLISVRNAGPATARQVAVTDRLPDSLALLSSPDDCASAPGEEPLVRCPALDRLPAGATAEFRLTVRALTGEEDRANPPGRRCTPIENTARVTSAVRDPDPSDNANAPGTTGPDGGRLCLVHDTRPGRDDHGNEHAHDHDHAHPGKPDPHEAEEPDHGRPAQQAHADRPDRPDPDVPDPGELADCGTRLPRWLAWASAALLAGGAALRGAALRVTARRRR
ncbi:DUF11 domain-containing protein [Streptomyces lavendulae]|uniref:DUF11 domain-containing protein n=1 Tax=Streptomyces lavendulae TaxID=1914 RepID=UPI0024A48426|nr:DUF11 domain-containing protein [Streptomyces lavendulae]GLX18811.1 hypothetical protein Slala01_24550 [Streptomyces lavendulae subsp. lavendulae]GLX29267.1 hypothetical protein Slala02_50870 [Streptomyces lavendulae subsp. lavendulae]